MGVAALRVAGVVIVTHNIRIRSVYNARRNLKVQELEDYQNNRPAVFLRCGVQSHSVAHSLKRQTVSEGEAR